MYHISFLKNNLSINYYEIFSFNVTIIPNISVKINTYVFLQEFCPTLCPTTAPNALRNNKMAPAR
jgi:hypothetical protein